MRLPQLVLDRIAALPSLIDKSKGRIDRLRGSLEREQRRIDDLSSEHRRLLVAKEAIEAL